MGDYKNIVYRSSWECKVMNWFDKNPDVISWASEEIIVPYKSPVDGRWHRYFPDFLVKIKNRENTIRTIMIEVKPEKQSKPPEIKTKVTKKYLQEVVTWGVNQAKWRAANEYCLDRKWEFMVMVSNCGNEFKYLTTQELLL